MKRINQTLGMFMIVGGLMCGTACEDRQAESSQATTTSPILAQEQVVQEDAKIVVSAEGAKIDPAVPKSRIPEGAYFCDMGTVHYARMEKGDGKCPECGMMLTQMPAEGAAKGPAGAVVVKADCGCAAGEKCEACEQAGEACTCGTGTPCEACAGCGGEEVAGQPCEHAGGESCDCAHGKKGHAAQGGHGDHAH